MKKNTRAHVANPEPRKRRKLRLARDTVKVLSSTDLARAAGGSVTSCDTTSYTTEHTRTAGDGGGALG